ncbi:MAG: cell division protein FtsZ [Flavobacteriaceae bacterium]|nr:cell division protein FtsZ [Flavobacteriaceae bacterium]MCI5088576.1 cell division protein FtsZ [Flavobacteriaceae bacterium]
MNDHSEFDSIAFDLPKNQSNVIKVIGVGGGGSNAINHMFQSGINGVDFVVCNTDAQALQNSPVPNKIQLGLSLTEGLGAGANPEVGEQSALESMTDIKAMLDTTTKMVFITAGMGGGTGTGAAPMIAKQAKELDILTVGIVTIPFQFEGKMRSEQAQKGIENLRAQVDSLIIINNNKLREVYGNLGFKAGFSKADEVLATAAKGIAEVITHHYTQNIDLRDAKTVLANSGTAIMGSAVASGTGRAHEAISKALDSPLLNDNKIEGAQNVLLLIVSGSQEITIDEIGEINEYIQSEAGHGANIIMGVGEDENLAEAISVTVIATGFNQEQQNDIVNTESKKIIHTLEEEQRAAVNLTPQAPNLKSLDPLEESVANEPTDHKVVHTLDMDELSEEASEANTMETLKQTQEETLEEIQEEILEETPESLLIPTTEAIKQMSVTYETVTPPASAPAPNTPETFIPLTADFEVIDAVDVSEEVAQESFEDPTENEAMDFSNTLFDLPLRPSADAPLAGTPEPDQSEEAPTIHFNLDDDIKDMEVKEPVEIVPVLEYNEVGEKRYSLDDYMDLEQSLEAAQPTSKAQEVEEETEEEAPSLKLEKKTVAAPEETTASQEVLDPMEAPIEALLKERAAERRQKLRDFNYKFNNSISKIEEIEKEPAYKRQGISLSETPSESKLSRTTLSSDASDEQVLRSNNSFLHDNVD